MATSTQNSYDRITEADAASQGVDGGLNAKTDASRLNPPSTTRADNAWYISAGTVDQLPAFQSSMPSGFQHIYNLSAKDAVAPALAGDTLIHGELPDGGSSPFTTPVWAQSNGLTPSRQQPVLPFSLRTRAFASALQKPLVGTQLQFANVDRWPLLMARQESATTAGRRMATGVYDGTTLSIAFGNVDGLSDTGETLTLTITAQWVEMAGIQGTQNFAIAYLNNQLLTVAVYDFFGNFVSSNAPTNNVYPVGSGASGATQLQTVQIFNHCQTTYVGYITGLQSAGSGVSSYSLYVRPVANLGTTYFLSGPATAQAGNPLQGFAISSPTSHQARGSIDYLSVTYDGNVYVIANPFGGGSYQSYKSSFTLGQVPGNSGVGSQGFNNALTTTIATPINDGLFASVSGAGVAITVFRHLSEQVTPAGNNSGGVAYQYVAVDAMQFLGGSFTRYSSNAFRTSGGAAICAKAFAACPSEANFAGASAAVSGFCVVRQGAWQPSFGYNGGTGIGQYWNYDQPTYFLLDHQARVVSRWSEGTAPIGFQTDLAASAQYATTATSYARFPMCNALGNVLISDTLATASDVSCLDIILPTWTMSQLTRAPFAPLGPTSVTSTTVPNYAVATPLAVHLSLSSTGSASPTVTGQSYTLSSGALTCIHDGRMVMEAGFHGATNNLLVTPYAQGDSGASSTALGTAGFYYYIATWEWTDAQGRLHRSAPSRYAFCSPPSGGQFYGAKVTVPSPISVRGSASQPVICRLYRSTLGSQDANYYLVAIQAVPCMGQANATVVSQYGTVISDAQLIDPSVVVPTGFATPTLTTQAAIYTGISSAYTGRVYPANPAPPFVWMTASRGRAFGLAIVQNQPRIYYSSVMTSGVPWEWHALNYAPVPSDVGDARSIDALDDKVMVFGSRLVGTISGDGPPPYSVTGTPSPNDGFGLVYPIPTSLGVLGSGAPCRMADGIVFQGSSGMQLIGRDLGVQAAGAMVDLITGRQVGNLGQVYCRGQMLSTLQSIVWSNPQGPALLYNYITKKWSTWPLLPNATCTAQRFDGTVTVAMQPIVGGKYAGRATALNPGSDMGALTLSTYSPIYQGNQKAAAMVLETPWLNPAGESAGESALFDVAVTGTYFGPHILQVEQAYNGGAYQSQVTRFSVLTAPPVYQYRVRPIGGTRLWSVRYRISLLPVTTLGAGYAMAGLSDLVTFAGSKQGTTRLLAGQSG